MPRRKEVQPVESEDSSDDQSQALDEVEEPLKVEPYSVLELEKSASADEVKKAYRKAALKHHPDKAPEHLKDAAHSKFQEVAFAYAVLSDPKRRARYDQTGSTSESIEGDDFNWATFYAEQFKDIITPDAIETFAKGYKNSDEERDDVLAAYEQSKGAWRGIFARVMLSDMLKDEDRFRVYIDEAIRDGDVKAFDAYTKETAAQKEKRIKAAKKEAEDEAREAEEVAQEAGVAEKLSKKKQASKKDAGLGDLASLIQSRQASRGGFFDALEAKYANAENGKKGKQGKKRRNDEAEEEPSEEAFQAAAARLKKNKPFSGGGGDKKAKRARK